MADVERAAAQDPKGAGITSRARVVCTSASALGAGANGHGLVDTVTHLTGGWTAVMGGFEPEFLALPEVQFS